ncbi:MAG: M48 family peptidase, partial [Bacteroidales bacterium]|nr:M48 family peptidase [Bacteroidales bacterium]
MHNTIFFLIIIIPVTGYLIERYLEHLNSKMWSENLPDKLKGFCDKEKYRKTLLYDRDNRKLEFWSSTFNLAVILIMIIAGGFAFVDEMARSLSSNIVIISLIF